MSDANTTAAVRRLAAFTEEPNGGNPAGVWIGDRLPAAAEMQHIACEVGDSETAFAVPAGDGFEVRYYSPEAEVPFCGHATIALGVALAEEHGEGTYRLDTRAGPVSVRVESAGGLRRATLTSVEPAVEFVSDAVVAEALALVGWSHADLDPDLPPRIAFAGARHLIVAARTRDRLGELDYDFGGLRSLMLDHDLTTVALVHRERADVFHARNPFPVGGIVEDAATGAAAAALGGYLRVVGALHPPARFRVLQGVDMGRPSELVVAVPVAGGIDVSGAAVALPPPGRSEL